MRLFKFRVPLDEERMLSDGMTRVSGVIAVIRAENLVEARLMLHRECEALGRAPWGDVADVTDETDTIGIITIAM